MTSKVTREHNGNRMLDETPASNKLPPLVLLHVRRRN
jgi:hypothetical protein